MTKRFFGDANLLPAAHGVDEGLSEFLAGGIAHGVNDAGKGMAALAAERQIVWIAGLLVELRAPRKQFKHALRPFAHDNLNGPLIA